MDKMIACCGLNCESCEARIATINNDDELRNNPASGKVMEKCGFLPTGEKAFDENLYHGLGRPMRVLRLEMIRK